MNAIARQAELRTVRQILSSEDGSGVVIVGSPGSGKSELVRELATSLRSAGLSAVLVRLRHMVEKDLHAMILSEAASVVSPTDQAFRELRSSAHFVSPISPASWERLRVFSPGSVLILDGLDEARDPNEMARAIEELSRRLGTWKFVIATRMFPGFNTRQFGTFRFIELGEIEAPVLLELAREFAPGLDEEMIQVAVRYASGRPMLLRLALRAISAGVDPTAGDPIFVDSVIGK